VPKNRPTACRDANATAHGRQRGISKYRFLGDLGFFARSHLSTENNVHKNSGDRARTVTYVILFDIDGTLLSSAAAQHDERLRYLKTIREVVGKEPSVEPARFGGMVDPQICRILLTELGLSDEKVTYFLPRVLTRMCEVYRKMDKKVVLNNGVRELLSRLAKSPRHSLGVLTGNLLTVAIEKLSSATIESYFSDIFCADRYVDRTNLVVDAVTSCVAKYQLRSCRNVMIVGDTPRDVVATNASGATSIGVASGVFSISQLREAGAMQVYPGLEPSIQFLTGLGLRG
jgi:phosphoglycolate phosphatase